MTTEVWMEYVRVCSRKSVEKSYEPSELQLLRVQMIQTAENQSWKPIAKNQSDS